MPREWMPRENRCPENRMPRETSCQENWCILGGRRKVVKVECEFVAGAIFGQGGLWLFVAGAVFALLKECDISWQVQLVFPKISEDSRSAKCCIFSYFFIQNASPRWDELGLRSGGCEITILSSDYPRNVVESSLYWRKQSRDFSLKSWTQNFLAGAVLGEFEGWLYLLHAL